MYTISRITPKFFARDVSDSKQSNVIISDFAQSLGNDGKCKHVYK